jgi:periplasmic protein TonB
MAAYLLSCTQFAWDRIGDDRTDTGANASPGTGGDRSSFPATRGGRHAASAAACSEPAGTPPAAGAHYPHRIIEKPPPKRVEPRPKPIPPPKPARSKKLAPDVRDQAEPGPRDTSVAGASGGSKPGPRLGGIRAGPGGEGSGEGGSFTSLPTGGYQVKPRYPDSARRQGIEGTVVVKAYVTEQGRVEQAQVEQSAGHPDLDQAAVEAVGRWRFEPARRGRQPMAMWVSVPVKFVLNR